MAVEIVHKPWKWVLTFRRRFGILTKSSRETRKTNWLRQKSWWNLLTNRITCDNMKKLLNGAGKGRNLRKEPEKSSWQGSDDVLKSVTFRRERHVPCKLNNVTKRKHQTETVLRNHNQSCRVRVQSITGSCNLKNEAMTNSSIKDLNGPRFV